MEAESRLEMPAELVSARLSLITRAAYVSQHFQHRSVFVDGSVESVRSKGLVFGQGTLIRIQIYEAEDPTQELGSAGMGNEGWGAHLSLLPEHFERFWTLTSVPSVSNLRVVFGLRDKESSAQAKILSVQLFEDSSSWSDRILVRINSLSHKCTSAAIISALVGLILLAGAVRGWFNL